MIVFTRLGGRGSLGGRGLIVFKRLGGGRGSVGVRGMIVFNRLGGRGSVGVRGMIVFKRLGGRTFPESSSRRHTAATGFAGISTDATLPLSKAASVLSRVYIYTILLNLKPSARRAPVGNKFRSAA